jgi:hypothetical protein
MNYKLGLLSALLFVSHHWAIAQSAVTNTQSTAEQSAATQPERFHADLSRYYKAYNNGRWQEVTSMLYPGIFDIIPKSQMADLFAQMGQMGVEQKTTLKNISRISDTVVFENLQYHKIDYNAGLTIALSGVMLENKEQVLAGYRATYGAENVHSHGNADSFSVDAIMSMVAIAKAESGDWKYVEYDDKEQSIANRVIPAAVMKQLSAAAEE